MLATDHSCASPTVRSFQFIPCSLPLGLLPHVRPSSEAIGTSSSHALADCNLSPQCRQPFGPDLPNFHGVDTSPTSTNTGPPTASHLSPPTTTQSRCLVFSASIFEHDLPRANVLAALPHPVHMATACVTVAAISVSMPCLHILLAACQMASNHGGTPGALPRIDDSLYDWPQRPCVPSVCSTEQTTTHAPSMPHTQPRALMVALDDPSASRGSSTLSSSTGFHEPPPDRQHFRNS